MVRTRTRLWCEIFTESSVTKPGDRFLRSKKGYLTCWLLVWVEAVTRLVYFTLFWRMKMSPWSGSRQVELVFCLDNMPLAFKAAGWVYFKVLRRICWPTKMVRSRALTRFPPGSTTHQSGLAIAT